MRDTYYRHGMGFLFVYSISDSSSLEDVKDRYQSLLENTVSLFVCACVYYDILRKLVGNCYTLFIIFLQDTTPETCKPVIFVGNKCDLPPEDRVITKEQGERVVQELSHGKAGHQETSAKSNLNVDNVS